MEILSKKNKQMQTRVEIPTKNIFENTKTSIFQIILICLKFGMKFWSDLRVKT